MFGNINQRLEEIRRKILALDEKDDNLDEKSKDNEKGKHNRLKRYSTEIDLKMF